MKRNYVVSAHQAAWLPDSTHLFLTDPYIQHTLELQERLGAYETIQVAQVKRMGRDEMAALAIEVDRRHAKLLPLLTARLNRIHGVSFDARFWGQLLSLPLVRHIGMCLRFFRQSEQCFDPALHECRVLSPGKYLIPDSFEDHRTFLQHSNIGQEQLWSVYCRLFDLPINGYFENTVEAPVSKAPPSTPEVARTFDWRKLPKKLLRRMLLLRSPRMGVINSFFSASNMEALLFRSQGKIQPISLPVLPKMCSAPDMALREQLAAFEDWFDRFDCFCVESLRFLLPKSLLEHFHAICHEHERYFARYDKLNWAVSEAWMSSEQTSFALAILHSKGVRQMFNEHNYMSRPFIGCHLKLIAPIVDQLVTFGWRDASIPNLVPGASLFEWVKTENTIPKSIDVLLVSGAPVVRAPEVCSDYGFAGADGATTHLDDTRKLLSAMGPEALGRMYFRAYPESAIQGWQVWSQKQVLKPFLDDIMTYDNQGVCAAKSLMQRARLIAVNYVSTAHLEAMKANIPTVFLWNSRTYCYEVEYEHIFDELIKVGICQTDATEAGEFIRSVLDNPEAWWEREEVQRAKNNFLNSHFNPPEVMLSHLLKHA
jgi:putative transferase (TIGR04331 family)